MTDFPKAVETGVDLCLLLMLGILLINLDMIVKLGFKSYCGIA